MGSDNLPHGDAFEAQLLLLWREGLGNPEASPEENFFDAGGTSLLAARLATRLTAALGRAVTAADILAHPSVRSLAEKLTCGAGNVDRSSGEKRALRQRGAFQLLRQGRASR